MRSKKGWIFTGLDSYIGRRIKERRIQKGISQSRLGEELGVSCQQVQKYETGANRVSASYLKHIADMFEVDFSYFFQEDPENSLRENQSSTTYHIHKDPDIQKAEKYLPKLNPALRKSIANLIKDAAKLNKKD